jgi:hypothetical protein
MEIARRGGRALVLLGALGLGCRWLGWGPDEPELETVWVHPSRSAAELYRDRQACQEQAAARRDAESPYVSAVDSTVAFHDCMTALGWRQERRPVSEP